MSGTIEVDNKVGCLTVKTLHSWK